MALEISVIGEILASVVAVVVVVVVVLQDISRPQVVVEEDIPVVHPEATQVCPAYQEMQDLQDILDLLEILALPEVPEMHLLVYVKHFRVVRQETQVLEVLPVPEDLAAAVVQEVLLVLLIRVLQEGIALLRVLEEQEREHHLSALTAELVVGAVVDLVVIVAQLYIIQTQVNQAVLVRVAEHLL